MGLYDDLLEEQPISASQNIKQKNVQKPATGLYDDLLTEEVQVKPSFADSHPFVASLPEAGKQFGVRAVKSYPEFAKGIGDVTALIGDKTNLQGLSNFGRQNANFWEEQSNKIQIDPKYQGLKGLSNKATFIPTVLGSVGDQTTNLLMAGGGGAAGAKGAASLGLQGAAKAGLITTGTAVPNIAQEGTYLDKIQAFQEIYGRMPTPEELVKIQNVAIGEKAINTALETVADRFMFNKLFPQGATTKGVRGVLKNAGEQALSEAGTETLQESTSVGAEKLLGINQGNNLERLADAAAIGGVTGGTIGGVTTAAARPYNTQFNENVNNSLKTPEVLKNVSAKIMEGGKALYDTTASNINKATNAAGNAIDNMINPPDTFDTLRQLSKDGVLNNGSIEKIAPKTVEKQKKIKAAKVQNTIDKSSDISVQDTNLPNLITENENLYKVSQDENSEIVDNSTIKDMVDEIQKASSEENNTVVLERMHTQENVTKNNTDKLAEIAPNTAAKQTGTAQHIKDFKKGNIVKDIYTGEVFEIVEPDKQGIGHLRNVDDDNISTLNAHNNARYIKYTPNQEEFIKKQEFKYNPKAKKMVNSENYIFSQQEVVDAYNNYIQNPTTKNKEIYQDIYGKYSIEYGLKEENFKKNDILTQIAPKTVEKQNNVQNQAIQTNKTDSNFKSDSIEDIAKEYSKMLKSEYVSTFHRDFAAALVNKDAVYLKSLIAQGRGMNENAKKMFTKYTGIKLPTTIKGKKEVIDRWAKGEISQKNNKKQNSGGVLNGYITKEVAANRPELSEEQKTARDNTGEISQRASSNERIVDEIGRENNVSDDGQRGISKKHAELINTNYKNQHELNTKIEDFINNEEYKLYQPGIRFPQPIKDWLKKYTGAGGLEKQGAEGKGLLSEYYTPHNIVKKMWEITSQYINTDGAKVLEPSVGIGRFLEHAPKNTIFDVVEMNPVSAKIAKILYPDANVTIGEFQEKFINKANNTPVKSVKPEYDIIIGNPPYGQYSGRYKGMGEGKKFSRLEAYFINRGLDSLKENGVMSFIVPSSFLDGAMTTGKQEIGKKCELLDAYRLPENTFDTTSIGTDIVVLRKNTTNGVENNINLGEWFKKHPDKILGKVESRKNRYGKIENYTKGEKNAVDAINTAKINTENANTTPTKAIKEQNNNTDKTMKSSEKIKKSNKVKKSTNIIKGKVEYKEYIPENSISKIEMELFNDTRVDGTLPQDKYVPNDKVSQYKGELYNDFNYMQGDIYEKLDTLEDEDITDKQKEIQRKKLMSVLPEPKTVENINFNPTSDFVREFETGEKEEIKDRSTYPIRTIFRPISLDKKFLKYIDTLTSSERNGVTAWDMRSFVNGDKIRIRVQYSSYTLSEAEKKKEAAAQRGRELTKIKNAVDKAFNDFVKNELSQKQKEKLADEWNRKFNAVYNPDYTKMPMMVQGLNSEFYGKPLVLQNVQIEGINFLTNKGVGLLGFEVGVGKTLTGIISTVQNMQMGRCKKPLILVPKQVKDNWIREINETFPNIKVNDVGNMGKFNGEIEEKSLTVATYEALGNIWYGNGATADLINTIYQTGQNLSRESTKRGMEKTKERAEKMLGAAEKGNKKLFNVQDLGFDHITVDEAHNFKNLFGDARADGQDGNTYVNITGGAESTRAARLFLLVQQILNSNGNRNVFMLTATPFNNSPLEVFNMISFIGKDKLDKMGLYNVYQFMENYADISSDWIVDSKNEVVEKQIVTGFKNASSLRELIKSVMLIRSAEDAGIVRPEKHTKRVILEPSKAQLDLIAEAEDEAINGKKDEGAVLKAINKSRKATLSPDIATDNTDVSPENFIKNSPKLNYVMDAIESMKKKDPKTSQILYMPLGVKFLPKIREYLENKGVYQKGEIEIIDSSIKDDRIPEICDSFNDENGKVKLIIGTSKIKEGMNLNKNSSVLYVPYMDWNPTDFVQIVGRIWRRGNKYSKIRVVVPLLKNSSDSFMFQKLNEKTDRINNIMDESKEYIDTSELNTAEEKINMISNPDKKVKMFIRVERQKLDAKINELQGRLETASSYKNNLENEKRLLKRAEENLRDNQEYLANTDKEKDKYRYDRLQNNINEYKKEISILKISIRKMEAKIERLELDFDGKDSEDTINAEIEKIKEQIEKLEEFSKKKLVEYQKEYEKERQSSKTIADYIKEFEDDTDVLYGNNASKNNKSEDSKPLSIEPQKRYEKTREAAYEVPVIKLETQGQKQKKTRSAKIREKAKEIDDAKKYNKVLKKAVQKWHSEISLRRYEVDKTLNSFINHTKTIAKSLNVSDKNLREIMPFLRERTDLPSRLKRPELEKVWKIVNDTKGLPERLTKLADDLSSKFDKYWKEYQAVQAKNDNIEDKDGVENYIFHDWKKDSKNSGNLITNAFITKSRHAKQRKIATYFDGIQGIEQENGEIKYYEPETLDYAELVKKQSDNLIKATVDKVLADSVKSFKAENGASLVLPYAQAPSNWIEINHSALNKIVAKPVSTKFGEKIAPDLQNKLSDIGIAIGNRLAKYKNNGMPNSLGKYIKNQPPEIRLQRWFSNKTLAHEIGHALDDILNLQNDGFINRYRNELVELNKERIEAFEKQGDKEYAQKDSELIAELFGVMFNDVESALKYAPGATSEIMERMTKSNKLAALLPGNYDWNNAKHVLEEKAVEFFREPVKVHPDIASTLKTVFEPKKEYIEILGFKPGKVLDEINAVAKMFNFSLSGFHAWALSESYLGNVGVEGLKDTFNFKKIYDSVKNNDYDIYKNDEIARQAIKDGLQIGATLDVQRGVTETLINNTAKWMENNIKGFGKPFSAPIKILGKATELNNKALWDVIHNNYKLNAYNLLIENETKHKKDVLSDAQRKEIAQWVNDSFGGQVWENLGISPGTKKTFSRWLMSPDWLLSSTRQFMGLFGSKHLHSKLNKMSEKSEFWQKAKEVSQFFGITSLTDDINATGTRGRLARKFWTRAAIQSLIYMNILNALFRAWDRDKHPELYPKQMTPLDYSMLSNSVESKSCVFIGRNQDGTERYVRFGKQFREVPEMMEDPIKKIGGKIAPIPQTLSTIATGRSLSGFENKEMSEAEGWKRVGVAAKQGITTFLPFSVGSMISKGADYSPFDMVATTSKGMTKYKAGQEFKKAFENGSNKQNIEDIRKSLRMNGFNAKDIKTIENRAKGQYTKRFKDGYISALEKGDKTKIRKITSDMQRKNISPIDQRKIYSKALSEYYKNRRIGG